MRRGNVDKVKRKQTGNGEDGLSASGTLGPGGFGGSGKDFPMKSPNSAAGTAFGGDLQRTRSGRGQALQPVGMKGAAAQGKSRRSSVDAVLEQFRNGNRDVEAAYNLMKQMEGEDIAAIVDALEQLSDILCQATYFTKAYDILSVAVKDIQGNPVLHELIARVAFVMENFEKSIHHNKRAA